MENMGYFNSSWFINTFIAFVILIKRINGKKIAKKFINRSFFLIESIKKITLKNIVIKKENSPWWNKKIFPNKKGVNLAIWE